MNAIEYGQTVAASEMLRDQRKVMKLMQITRSYYSEALNEHVDSPWEVLIEGRVEFNPETDGFWVLDLFASDKYGEEVDLTTSERQEASYLLIKEYFENVWG